MPSLIPLKWSVVIDWWTIEHLLSPGRGKRESQVWKEEGIECEELSRGSLSHAKKPTLSLHFHLVMTNQTNQTKPNHANQAKQHHAKPTQTSYWKKSLNVSRRLSHAKIKKPKMSFDTFYMVTLLTLLIPWQSCTFPNLKRFPNLLRCNGKS